jgi:adenosylhomocysteine nucleosidase
MAIINYKTWFNTIFGIVRSPVVRAVVGHPPASSNLIGNGNLLEAERTAWRSVGYFASFSAFVIAYIPDWRALVAPGGHGKTQFAVQAQYLIGQFPSTKLVICAGAAGSLSSQLSVGDVVVGTETVEHDYRLLFATRPLPRFPGHGPSIDALRGLAHGISDFRVVFDVIASGDEDVVVSERAQAIRDQTGAACVAWEGSGAARAALFNGIGSLEIRAVTDAADQEAPQRFDVNLPIAMANLASLLRLWLG